jgi:phage gp37-like protein
MIGQAEDAILAKVQAILGATVRAVESIPASWTEETLRKAIRLAPGVFVAFAGGRVAKSAGTVLDSQWIVHAVTAHASGEAARRRGDGTRIGAYEILAKVLPALDGYVIPGVGTLSLERVDNMYSGTLDSQGVMVYGATFSLPIGFDVANAPDISPFETFHADYDVEPHQAAAEHTKWLQEPPNHTTSLPEAQDQVTLPQ